MAPLSQEQIDKEFAAQLSLLDSQRKGKDIVNEGEYSEDDFEMLLAMAISIEERSNSSKPSSSTGSTHQNQVVSDTGDDESDDVVPAVAEGAAGSSSNRSVGRNAGKNWSWIQALLISVTSGGSVQAQGGAPAPPVAGKLHYSCWSCTSARRTQPV
ncbi:unnamed protein product [Prunus armeniaca]